MSSFPLNMRKTVTVFGASNSRQSINKRLASYAARQLADVAINLLDLNDYEMPIYSIDRQREMGIPEAAYQFKAELRKADGIIISFAEHNGAYSAAFKNIFDWVSRIESDVWMNKPMLLMATSPGARGGRTVLEIAVNKFRFMNKNTILSFSLPSFNQNFSEQEGITDAELAAVFHKQLHAFEAALDAEAIEV